MGLSPAKEGEYSRCQETRHVHRATIACLQQRVLSVNRHGRWWNCPLAIGATKEPSDGNQELDCHRKVASFSMPSASNRVAMSTPSNMLEASIAT